MENALFLASVMGPVYIIIGLSMLIHTKEWQKIIKAHKENYYSLVLSALVEVTIGVTVISMYNVWEWNAWLLVTLSGWGMLLEGGLYLLLHKSWADGWLGVWRKDWLMYVVALIFVIVGTTLGYYAYLA